MRAEGDTAADADNDDPRPRRWNHAMVVLIATLLVSTVLGYGIADGCMCGPLLSTLLLWSLCNVPGAQAWRIHLGRWDVRAAPPSVPPIRAQRVPGVWQPGCERQGCKAQPVLCQPKQPPGAQAQGVHGQLGPLRGEHGHCAAVACLRYIPKPQLLPSVYKIGMAGNTTFVQPPTFLAGRHGARTGSWDRCAARAATAPLISVLALFSVIALVSCVFITLGPIAHVETNSRCYSAMPPKMCARTLLSAPKSKVSGCQGVAQALCTFLPRLFAHRQNCSRCSGAY